MNALNSKITSIRKNVMRRDIRSFTDISTMELTTLTIWFDNWDIHSVHITIDKNDEIIHDLNWYIHDVWPDISVSQRIGLASKIPRAWELWIADFIESNRESMADRPFTAGICRENIKRLTLEEML